MTDKAKHFRVDFLHYFLLFQGLGFFMALIISIYGGTGDFLLTLVISMVFSNLNGFSTWFFFHIFNIDWLEMRQWHGGFILKSITVLSLSILVATEIGMAVVSRVILHRELIPFFSSWHFYMMLLNIAISAIVVLAIALYQRMRYRLQRREQEVEELRHLQLRTQLAVLKARLNPHFLFNSLNAILDLVYKEPRQVEAMVHSLAQIYRRVLNDAEREWGTVGEEIELLESYLQVEQIRLGDRLRYTVSCPPELHERPLPSLLLQPLVENAVLHGIAPKIGGGTIAVSMEPAGERLRIQVRDDGMGFAGRRSGSGFGLASIEQRLKIIYPENHDFFIGAEAGGGTMVRLELP
ncbi:MAG: histidine kinase [Candidatus Aminicenantes bacterium]|nr:histidine kinase [Candidatus Aminicenantes bacterium]